MNFKIVVSEPKQRKAYQKEVEQKASGLLGRKIGEVVSGDLLGLSGYKLEITGGSDKEGFPMRKDVEGPVRKKVLLSSPPGFHPKRKGHRKRKSIRGNTISAEIIQVNMKVAEYGKKSIEELLGVKKERAKPEEAKAEEKPKEEAKSEEVKEEKGPEEKSEKEKPSEVKKKEKTEKKQTEAKPETNEEKKEQKPEKKPTEEKAEENPQETPNEEKKETGETPKEETTEEKKQ